MNSGYYISFDPTVGAQDGYTWINHKTTVNPKDLHTTIYGGALKDEKYLKYTILHEFGHAWSAISGFRAVNVARYGIYTKLPDYIDEIYADRYAKFWGGFPFNFENQSYNIIFLLFFGASSCLNHEGKKDYLGKVHLEILNSEVHYVAIDSTDLLASEIANFTNIRGYTKEERLKACNVLTFKLTNNSNKKYYFVLDTNEMDFFQSRSEFLKKGQPKDSISIRRMCYLIDDITSIDKMITTCYNSELKFQNDSLNIYITKYMQIEGKINRDNYQYFADEASVNHSFVIYPGEYKIFRKKLFLPIDLEKDKNHFLSFSALILSPQYQYDFSLAISANKKDIWKSLHDYQRKEIEDNGYEIFDGTILSNKVPLKLKK